MLGRMNDLHQHFQKYTCKLFEKHDIEIIGFWTSIIGTLGTLYYMLVFDDLSHRDKALSSFSSDLEWIKVRTETERNGPLLRQVRNIILRPTLYSPLQ